MPFYERLASTAFHLAAIARAQYEPTSVFARLTVD